MWMWLKLEELCEWLYLARPWALAFFFRMVSSLSESTGTDIWRTWVSYSFKLEPTNTGSYLGTMIVFGVFSTVRSYLLLQRNGLGVDWNWKIVNNHVSFSRKKLSGEQKSLMETHLLHCMIFQREGHLSMTNSRVTAECGKGIIICLKYLRLDVNLKL